MQKRDGQLLFSPSDLTKYLGSEFVTWMDRYYLEFPDAVTPDPDSETDKILQQKGLSHENDFLLALKAQGKDVYEVPGGEERFGATAEAMKEGREIIFQGALSDPPFIGYADFLVKTEGKSDLGRWHYEPWDTKLALKPKPYFLIQLACYADMLQAMQGLLPARIHIVLGDRQQRSFRTEDYFYYYRQLRQAFLQQQDTWDRNVPPDLIGLEDFGRWTSQAEEMMEAQDHLCRVANIRTIQIRKLYSADIRTMTDLAQSSLAAVPRMQPSTLHTLSQQARLQIESNNSGDIKFEVIKPESTGQGLEALPDPSPMDVYFDMEGYPLVEGGLEYLFGATVIESGVSRFYDWWAHNSEQEKHAFEEFIDWVYERWQIDRSMHIYHYASYERTALRRLMGKYGTRESEVDELLRQEVFVDLYAIVRQSIRAGLPNYSIKSVERLYRSRREGEVSTALDSVVYYQRWLDEKDGDDWQSSPILADIRSYNKDDCVSTWQLAQWLRELRRRHGIEWRPKEFKEPPQSPAAEARARAAALAASIMEGIPADPASKTEPLRLRELLAHLLEFHWREAKPVFWAKYDRHEMTEQELFDDPSCLSGLTRDSSPPRQVKKSYHYDYTFDPDQDTKIDAGDSCFFAHDLNETITIADIDPDAGKVVLTRGTGGAAPPDRLSLIKNEFVDARVISDSIYRTAEALMQGQPLPPALEDFLSRRRPRIRGRLADAGPLILPGSDLTAATTDIISRLDESTLCIQGPPGSGKTYTAAHAIAELLAQGNAVGITSNSHKAIAHLMDRVAELVAARGETLRAVKVQSKSEDFHVQSAGIAQMSAKELLAASRGAYRLIGGTAWLFSKEEAVGMLDYLFIDEAGQVSVANLVGMAPSTRNIVLIGDQMQLAQPLQGSHPGESGKSILEYLLEDRQVIPEDFGIFLGTTWRMHPDVCSFISGAVYEDRLAAQPQAANRSIVLPARDFPGASQEPARAGSVVSKETGILYVPVSHEGNAQDSEEEARAIVQIVAELKRCSLRDGDRTRAVSLDDILIVAPYNMQVRRLRSALPGARVGSVDKFQGQEAAIVIVSMCSSSVDDSARGLEFIFSKNRLNVAISRAQCLAIVVGSPLLARAHCKRIEQMELVNLFCRIVEAGSQRSRQAVAQPLR